MSNSHQTNTLAHQLGISILQELHKIHGSSFYLFDISKLCSNYGALAQEFRSVYPKFEICHSYKTNYVPLLSHVLLREGAFAEVVSETEFDMACLFGAPTNNIIVNGPVKSQSFIEKVLRAGALINIDSIGEAKKIATFANANESLHFRVGFRCNFSMPNLKRSRFGIDAENGELNELFTMLSTYQNIAIEGLHCHFSGDRSVKSYSYRTSKMVEIAGMLFKKSPPRFINIGGGLAGNMPDCMRKQFPSSMPSFRDYADVISKPLIDFYGQNADSPTLLIEPGMALLCDTFEFVCQVATLKTIGTSNHAITTGSIYNVKPTLNDYDLPITVISAPRPKGEKKNWIVSGNTCMEVDIISSNYNADLCVGDYLVISNVGAYTVVLTPPFINTAPAIIAIDKNMNLFTARETETLEHILGPYNV
jgi:diaminopimelate decarboxylase